MKDPHSHDPATLERLVDHALRGLPGRVAPRDLTARVQAELARRAALSWWRRGYDEWPALARGTFVALCAGLVCLSVLAGVWLSSPGRALARPPIGTAPLLFGHSPLAWTGPLSALWGAAQVLGSSLAGAVPSTWLDAGAAFALVAYAVLFGSAAMAYRVVRDRH